MEEIFELSVSEWNRCKDRIRRLAAQIDAGQSWQDLYHGYFPPGCLAADTFDLYRQEIDQVREFFGRNGFAAEDLSAPLVLAETPLYLRSVRSSASFAAAFSQDPSEKSYFYITTRFPGQNADESLRLQRRLNREYLFLTAHEAVPGHHLLDSMRRRNPNRVRRQIESPLFYEGWATYAESLLTEYGYVRHPMDRLVDLKRRLWRSARCQIDVGLPTAD